MDNEIMNAGGASDGAAAAEPQEHGAGSPAGGTDGGANQRSVTDGGAASAEAEAAFSDGQDEGGTGGTPSDGGTPQAGDGRARTPEERQRDAEFARRRREAEVERRIEAARAEERAKARAEATIAALGGVNPYTRGEMKDAHDVAIYEKMRAIEQAGGDPVGDFAKSEAEAARESERVARESAEQQARYATERADFEAAHPDVDLDGLLSDPDFADYAEGKIGKRTLSEIYDGYTRMTERYRTDAEAKVQAEKERMAQRMANAQASPGAGSNAAGQDSGFYSREQVAAMSPSEVGKNLDKIYESMKHW